MPAPIKRLPSPALVIAVIALIAAVGGGTYALAVSSQKTKRIAKKVANQQIKKKADGLDVDHANTADEAAAAGSAFSAVQGDRVDFTNDASPATIMTLRVPEVGSYVIDATFNVANGGDKATVLASCELTGAHVSGSDLDRADFNGLAPGSTERASMQVVHTYDSPGSVDLACTDNGIGSLVADDIRITAFEVAHLTDNVIDKSAP